MEKKVLLKGAGKDKLRCKFVFDRKLEVVDAIDKILFGLKFSDSDTLSDMMFGGIGRPTVEGWDSDVVNLRNDSYSVDVFFGSKDIFLIVNSREDRQGEISDVVFEFAEFGDVEKKNISKLGGRDWDGKS